MKAATETKVSVKKWTLHLQSGHLPYLCNYPFILIISLGVWLQLLRLDLYSSQSPCQDHQQSCTTFDCSLMLKYLLIEATQETQLCPTGGQHLPPQQQSGC